MHRSGTSTITRGLQALGIDLGQNLLPPVPDINNMGFFEDIDINAINVELMHSFDFDWHTLAPIPAEEFLSEKIEPLRIRAINLLQSRLQNVNCFAFKDPRTCRLLPFWQRIFIEIQLNVFYVIVLRNPLSVANSLENLGIAPEKCYYLWLEHVLPSVLLTQETPRLLVDFDLLLENTEKQLMRIAKTLNISNKLDPTQLYEFKNNFIDRGLRHTVFTTEDVYKDSVVPILIKSVFKILSDVAIDKLSLDSEKVTTIFEHVSEQMEGMAQALSYIHRLENIVVNSNQNISEKNRQIESLNNLAVQLNFRLEQVHSSIGWRLLSPVRITRNLIKRVTQIIKVELFPFNQLQFNKKTWMATGSDPQFLLIAEQNWPDLAGEYLLKINSLSEIPMKAQIFFDYGQGFDPDRTTDFQLTGNGDQDIPLSVPLNCHAIRLDPCDMPAEFKLSVHGLKKLKNAKTLPSDLLKKDNVYLRYKKH